MKTLIRARTKPHGAFVPMASFEFERFEVRVRRVTHHRLLPIEFPAKRLKRHLHSTRPKTIPMPFDAAQRPKDFPPSPSLQGLGLMCLRSGARPVDRPAATSSLFVLREPNQIASESHTINALKRQNQAINITSRDGPKGLIARRSSYD
jgi:hypothetical protein